MPKVKGLAPSSSTAGVLPATCGQEEGRDCVDRDVTTWYVYIKRDVTTWYVHIQRDVTTNRLRCGSCSAWPPPSPPAPSPPPTSPRAGLAHFPRVHPEARNQKPETQNRNRPASGEDRSHLCSLRMFLETRNPKPETRNLRPLPPRRALDAPTSRSIAPRPETRNPEPETRNPTLETRNLKPKTRNPKPGTRNPKPETLRRTRNLKPDTRETESSLLTTYWSESTIII